MPLKKHNELKKLTEIIVKGIQDKKGLDIISLNLMKIPNSISDYFVLCHGNNKIQVEAIAESVENEVRKTLGEKPWHKEGFENAEWILLDYVIVVVHIFQKKTRSFYDLENLWADAEIRHYSEE
jgi:ribosome-associated protein